jgi:hypothetical protein
VVGLSLLIAQPLLRPALSAVERAHLRRAVARVARGDAALRVRQGEAALREYEAGFCLMIVRADPKVADEVNRHHVGLLSRLLAVATARPARVRLLASPRSIAFDRRARCSARTCSCNRSCATAATQLERGCAAACALDACRGARADRRHQVLSARKVAYQ